MRAVFLPPGKIGPPEESSVLFVDDEPGVLHSLERLFAGVVPRISLAGGGAEAVDFIRKNEVSVIVSDYRMPGMNGVDFLQLARRMRPEAVRILITVHGDMRVAMDAINKGEVYKFVTKPWDNAEIKNVVLEAAGRYGLVRSLKNARETALYSLAKMIELRDTSTGGHCDRVADYALCIAEAMNLSAEGKKWLRYGAWLHDCGKIGVPDAILNKKGPLTPGEFDVMKNHGVWGAEVARLAGLPEPVVNIILSHHERWDGTGYPCGLKGEQIPLEARIVSVADFYDALTSDRPYRRRFPVQKAILILRRMSGACLDPGLAGIFLRARKQAQPAPNRDD